MGRLRLLNHNSAGQTLSDERAGLLCLFVYSFVYYSVSDY